MKHLALAVTLLAAPVAADAAPFGPYSDFLVFGDSLSDPGNAFAATGGLVPDPLLYPDGQFTNGDTWASVLGADFGSGMNYAFGGARARVNPADTTTDLGEQIADFIGSGTVLGPRPLAAVFVGGNDLRDAFAAADPATVVTEALTGIVTGVGTLLAEGVDEVLVFGLPDLGRLPAFVGTAYEGVARGASIDFNATLAGTVAALFPGAARYMDTFGIFDAIIADAAAAGLDTTHACLLFDPACTANADSYVFYDPLHPTAKVHAAFAQAVRDQVAPVPLPAGLPLLAAGLAALGLLHRRRAG